MKTTTNNKGILRINSKRKKDLSTLFFVLDIETKAYKGKSEARPENFVLGVIYGKDFSKIYLNVDEMRNDILTNPIFENKYIFCHFAEFDYNILFGNIYNIDKSAIFNGRFIAARKNKRTFADSLNIFSTSVKKLGYQLGIKKLDMPKKFLSGKVKEITKRDIKYCTRDCEIVYKALLQVFNFVGNIKITLASLSLELFKNEYLDKNIYFNKELCNEFFNSYYGGRNECFKIGLTNAIKLDINSMYPFAMITVKFPDPNNLIREDNIDLILFKYLITRCEGLANIEIYHKPTYFGFLPFRHKEKLMFCGGNLTGTWNFNELRFALKNKAIEIKKVNYIIYSKHSIESPFINFVNDLYKKRKQETGFFEYVYKILLNSLYGKFAQRAKGKTTYYKEIPVKLLKQYTGQGVKYEVHIFSDKRNDCFVEIIKNKNEILNNTIPLFSSYITSFSRVLLLKNLLKYENEIPVYCDTDSIFLEIKPDNFIDSEKLGDFKIESGIVTNISGLKNYEYLLNDELITKIKGVPKTAKKIAENTYLYPKFVKTKEGLIRGIESGSIINQKKVIKSTYNKRIVLNDGTTKLLMLNES